MQGSRPDEALDLDLALPFTPSEASKEPSTNVPAAGPPPPRPQQQQRRSPCLSLFALSASHLLFFLIGAATKQSCVQDPYNKGIVCVKTSYKHGYAIHCR